MMKRIEAIDRVFLNNDRTYIDVVFSPLLLPVKEQVSARVKVIKVNAFLHLLIILFLTAKARLVYVHSVYNASRAIPIYFCRSVVTDLHGLIPEEEVLQGKILKSIIHGLVEQIVIKRSKCLVTVTRAMEKHFFGKYGKNKATFLYLPIFESEYNSTNKKVKESSCPKVVIYSGGLQAWQNIDKMLSAICEQKNNFCFQIFTCDLDNFVDLIGAKGLSSSVFIANLPKKQLNEYYEKAHFGFLLRDKMPVNSAACPTKLIEYINHGIIPIVLQPEIGDFAAMGYSYLTLDSFLQGHVLGDSEMQQMCTNNMRILQQMKGDIETSKEMIKLMCN